MPEQEVREEIIVDFAVIGSGPAGQKAAIQAAKLGKSVALIENYIPGGACLNSGTIPSKALREAILDLSRYHERTFYGPSYIQQVAFIDLNYRLQTVLEGERAILLRQFKRNHIQFLQGSAQFVDPYTLNIVDDRCHILSRVKASFVLIATGSIPRNPLHVPFDAEVIVDSTRLISIDHAPKTMVVLGGGIVGAEYASFFTVMGTKVTVLDKKDRLLPELDSEIGMHLQSALKDGGLVVEPRKVLSRVERKGNRGIVYCQDGSSYEADLVLYALGREANVQGLHLENAGLHLSERGYIHVNEHFQTAQPHIYAAGDVIGFPALASTSMEQGRLSARHAFQATMHSFPSFFPIGIYTIPEISYCGYTEEELQEKGFHYEVGRAYYYEIARSHITGSNDVGLFKILFHKETGEILGVHIVGRSATELIHIGQVAMSFHATIDYFVDQIFNYPTFAEGYRIAALNGMNKIPQHHSRRVSD